MSFTILFTEQAAREMEAAANWWAVHRSRDQAAEWYVGFSEKIETLRVSPDRFPLADEDPDFS